MRSIKRGVTLLELTMTISLMAVISFGITSAYITGARRADEAMLMSESVSLTGMISERLTDDINRSKAVAWDGTDLTLTLYNDSVITYNVQTDAGGDRFVARNGMKVVETDYGEYYIDGAPIIDNTSRTVSLTVVVTVQTRDSEVRKTEADFKAYWRNE